MISRTWLSEGRVNIVKVKVKGFKDVDEVKYGKLVTNFMEVFEDEFKRLRKVDTKRDVTELEDFVRRIPRFAEVLDGQMSAFKKGWDDIWNSLEIVKVGHRCRPRA